MSVPSMFKGGEAVGAIPMAASALASRRGEVS